MAERPTDSETSPNEDKTFLEEASAPAYEPDTEVTRRLTPSQAEELIDDELVETVHLDGRAQAPEPSDSPSHLGHFGKYEILEKIGAGGFGLVQRGRDPILKRIVAIKTCTSAQERVRQRFFREAQISAGLQHPNITTVHDLGFEEGVPFLVQEFLSGEDLSDKIERCDPLPTSTRLDYLLQIARGLHHAHESGVLHRDVKPGNVRVLENGRVKLLDFGIARLEEEENPITTEGVAIGTVGYLSPEQLEGGKVDRRTDIFAFGVLAYEFLTYKRPFPGNKFSEVAFKLMFEAPTPLGEAWPDCPAALDELVSRCLAKEREERCESFVEVIAVLEEIIEAITPDTRPTAVRSSLLTSSEIRAQRRRRDLLRRGAAAAVVFAVVIAGWFLWSAGESSPPVLSSPKETAEAIPETTVPPPPPEALPEANGESSIELESKEAPPTTVEAAPPAPAPPPPSPRQETSKQPETSPSFESAPPPQTFSNPPEEISAPLPPEELAEELAAKPADSEPISEEQVNTPPTEELLESVPLPTQSAEDSPPAPPEEIVENSTPQAEEEAPSEPPKQIHEVKPQVLERGQPVYPTRAQRRRKEGQVVVGVRVGESGEVLQTLLKSSSTTGFGFEEAARKAASISRFSPGTRNGVPTTMWVEMIFAFRLP